MPRFPSFIEFSILYVFVAFLEAEHFEYLIVVFRPKQGEVQSLLVFHPK